MPKSKHLTLSERITIEKSLNDSMSFKAIARLLVRDCTSIAKEVKKHIVHRKAGCYGKPFNNCIHRFDCQ
jgi:IS30 family transposase